MIRLQGDNIDISIERVEGGVIITTKAGFEPNTSPRRFIRERDFSPYLKKLLNDTLDGFDVLDTTKGIALDASGQPVVIEEKETVSDGSIYE